MTHHHHHHHHHHHASTSSHHSHHHGHHHHHHRHHHNNNNAIPFFLINTLARTATTTSSNEIVETMRQPLLLGDSSSQQQQKRPEHLQEKTSYSTLIKYLYVGHFLARWGARMWEFSVALYMINVWPDSLLFTALYGVVEAASTALFGPIVGRWVDRFTYVQVLRMWLFTQNLSFIVAGGTVTVLLVYSSLRFTSFPAFMSLIILTNISGAVGVLSTLAGTILVEREWIVVISSGKSPETLTEMNSVIRRIDLACNLFAPVVSGFIISFVSLKDSAITFMVWNLVSVSLIYWLLISVYNGIPTLSENNEKRKARHSQNETVKGSSSLEGNKNFLSHDETDLESGQKCNWKEKLAEQFLRVPYVESWTVYLQQDVVLPGIALAILYFTVLSFGSLMTATLEWEGTPAFVIGSMRGVSATIGIAATLLYPILHSRISTLRTGLWSIWMQWTFLLVCVASIWVRNSRLSAWLLMGGVATSRLGLWMFDLSVMQQMQDLVPDSDRCIVGGVQNSLQSMFDLLTYVMGIIISNPQDFWKLTILSFALVSLAAILYTFHIYRVRKHLFHYEKLLSMINWWFEKPQGTRKW